jgi:hypothetical protein
MRSDDDAGLHEAPAPYNPYPIDGELMGRVTDAIIRLYREEKVTLFPIDQGRLIAQIYCEVELVEDPLDRPGALKYLIEAKRRELRQANDDPSSSKRLA